MSSESRYVSLISKHLPITRWIKSYSKKKFVSDVIAGLTVGITMIPQSIAYAALANLTPEYGLNCAIAGCFVYAVFGTIKEVFIGPSSLMAILSSAYVHHLNVDFIVFLTFLAGCVEFFLGVLKLGFLVDFISVPVISGFISAVAGIIFVSQLKDLMGLKFKSGSLIQNINSLITNRHKIKYYDFVLGIICIVLLFSLRYLKDIKIKEGKNKKSYLKIVLWFISISRNAIIVFSCMCLSGCIKYFYGKVPFSLTADVDSGLPDFKIPPFSTRVENVTYSFTDMVAEIGTGIIVVPLVAVLENIAIGKTFSKGKTIEATQEMFALSFSNLLASCLGAMPTCGALTRSAVANASNVQSPIASIYAGTVVLLAVTFLSPYFCLIPRATLAAVLICALLFLIEWEIVIPLWKTSRRDFFILVTTFLLSLVFGVEIGLLCGIAISLLNLSYLWSNPGVTTEICKFAGDRKYLILTFDKGLYFPSMNRIRNVVLEYQKVVPDENPSLSATVIDCSYFSGVDYTVVKELCMLITELNEQGKELLLLNPRINVVELCQTVGNSKNILHYYSKQEIEDYLSEKVANEETVVNIPKDYIVKPGDDNKKSSRELLPLIEDATKKHNAD